MRPINKKQRNAAILKFVLVYILTVIVLALPVYATFKISDKQCDIDEHKIENLERDYEKCRKERNKLLSKTNLSREDKNEFEKIYSDYLSTYSKLNENVEVIDNIINSGNDVWDEDRINRITAANGEVYQSKNEFRDTNGKFSNLLNKK